MPQLNEARDAVEKDLIKAARQQARAVKLLEHYQQDPSQTLTSVVDNVKKTFRGDYDAQLRAGAVSGSSSSSSSSSSAAAAAGSGSGGDGGVLIFKDEGEKPKKPVKFF
jgi:hypothetical protein